MKKTLIVLGLVVLVAAGAFAQDSSAAPTYGQLELSAGFTPDPQTVEIYAGGPNDAGSYCYECAGSVATAPDVDLYYEAGSWGLYIMAESEADTTLLVRAPDGEWYGNDDAVGYNPVVAFEDAMSGLYSIWVGTFGDTAPAIIVVTEGDPR